MVKNETPKELWERENAARRRDAEERKVARDREIAEKQKEREAEYKRFFGTQKPWKPV